MNRLPLGSSNKVNTLALIAAYNEADHITHVVRKAGAQLPVLVIDDGSSDRTAYLAKKAGATVLSHEVNQGKGSALRTGLRWAIEQGYDGVVTLDGDGQHDPLEIPKFLAAYRAKRADLIIGRRCFREMPFLRRVSNWIARQGFSLVLGQAIPDNQSGYRLISSPLIAELLSSHEVGFEFEVEMITICTQKNFKLDWVPIRTIYADEKSHIRPLQHSLNFVRVLWQTYRRLQRFERI